MYLKRLEIQGFKSFANKTTLEFEKGMTAVVGPNGSGKSNVADAIRWVLGEQSLKQLRGKKSEDVIFAGSEKKSRQSFASVAVTFDNRDKRIPIDYSEVSITRTIDRSGESEYMINGNKVRLLDVIDLILKSNIGTSRHTVIGQGTIDQMILAGPAEVKNLLDEASGVKTYYIRREKTLKRLEQTAQNLIRVQDLLTEIEPRLKSLRRQAKKMEERAAIEEDLKTYQTEFFGGRYWQLHDQLQDVLQKLDIVLRGRAKLESEIEVHRKNLEKNEGSNKAEVQAYQQIQAEIKKMQDRKNKLMEDIAMIRGKLQAEKSVGGDSRSLGVEKSNLENQHAHLKSEIETTRQAAKKVEKELLEQQKLFADVTEKLEAIQKNLNQPDNVNFQELANDVESLHQRFEAFYENIENAQDVSLIIGFAQDFREGLIDFKKKTLQLAQNPFFNFDKQKRALNEVLMLKDRATSELNSIELRKSKISINLEHLESELSKIEQKLLHVNLDLQKASSGSVDDYFKQLLAQEKELNAQAVALASEIGTLEQKISEYHANEQGRKSEILEEERAYRNKMDELSKLRDQESTIQIEKARIETLGESLVAEAGQALGLAGLEQIKKERVAHASKNLEERIQRLKNQLEVIGGIDELTLKEYQETEQRYTYLSSQVEDLNKGMGDLRQVIEELDRYIKKQFQDSFQRINEKFEQYFRVLFNGGRAYLNIIRSQKENKLAQEDQSEEAEDQAQEKSKLRPEEKILAKYETGTDDVSGIDIKATPPGKKLASISALSGGERSLTSIALLCALLSCFPSPFVMLDEVDAALDEANTIRFAQILGTLANQTQFITVTHNRETMRQAHTLYGVTMGEDGISKILSLKIEQAQAFAK